MTLHVSRQSSSSSSSSCSCSDLMDRMDFVDGMDIVDTRGREGVAAGSGVECGGTTPLCLAMRTPDAV